MCSSLYRFNLRLVKAFRVRETLIVRKRDDDALINAENDLERAHRLIARHRESCTLCKLDGALLEASLHTRRFRANVFLSIALAESRTQSSTTLAESWLKPARKSPHRSRCVCPRGAGSPSRAPSPYSKLRTSVKTATTLISICPEQISNGSA
jgi:hypothetical protein